MSNNTIYIYIKVSEKVNPLLDSILANWSIIEKVNPATDHPTIKNHQFSTFSDKLVAVQHKELYLILAVNDTCLFYYKTDQ